MRVFRSLNIPPSANKWVVTGVCIGLLPVLIYSLVWYIQRQSLDNCMKQYRFTSASLDCAGYEESSQRLRDLDTVLGDARRLYERQGKVTRVSVWVRDLESKQWAATQENETYAPASLMKLPLMIAYFKLAEVDPRVLEQEIMDNESIDLNSAEYFSSTSTLITGQTYTVEKLIQHMIVDSDNNAAELLFASINQDFFARTLLDLGIQIPAGDSTIDFITVKSYASIFRNLYNASYLNRTYSEKALELLSSSIFPGILSTLPKGTVIADKYGERFTNTDAGPKRELHDCGIVYLKEHPYSICIMTEGSNYNDMLWAIQSISAITYNALAK